MKIKRKLMLGDCLERLKELPDNSVDMVLTDTPYGTTACKWDSVIDFELMWKELKRVTKDNGAICLFGSEPFSSALRMSNIKNFKYDWIWQKDKGSGHLNAKKQPLKSHEIVSVFYSKRCLYNPQMWESKPMNTVYKGGAISDSATSDVYRKQKVVLNKKLNSTERYPITNIKFNHVNGQSKIKLHPTQKPVALLEYLIKTYNRKGETVLDFTMGSGSTGVAAMKLRRSFIGIENGKKYFNIAKNRIKNWKDEK